jgi:hypothetical protein
MALTLTPDWQYATPPQVAKLIGVDQAKILCWIRGCELVAIDTAEKLGGRARYRITRADWEAFLERRKTTALRSQAEPRASRSKVPKPRKQYV